MTFEELDEFLLSKNFEKTTKFKPYEFYESDTLGKTMTEITYSPRTYSQCLFDNIVVTQGDWIEVFYYETNSPVLKEQPFCKITLNIDLDNSVYEKLDLSDLVISNNKLFKIIIF